MRRSRRLPRNTREFKMALIWTIFLVALGASTGTAQIGIDSSDGAPIPTTPQPIKPTTTVGPVTTTVSLTPSEPVIGDSLTLMIEVTSEPEVEVLMPSFGEALGRFVILDFSPRERINREGQTISSQQYTLDVPMSGDWTVPPLLVEFIDHRPGNRPAPEGDDAFELLTEPIDFKVESVLPTDVDSELKEPLGTLAPIPTALERAEPWIRGFIFVAVPAALLLFWILRRAHRRIRRSAYEIAVEELKKLQFAPRGTPEEIDQFYVALSGIVRRYLEKRFEIRAPESTTEEFLDRATRSTVLTAAHKELLVGFLTKADLVKFAARIPSDLEIAESIRSAEQFLEDTRDDAPLVEVRAEEGVTT